MISDNRGLSAWFQLRRATSPYVRQLSGQPLVVLTEPARHALVIEPTGRIAVRAMSGVGGANPDVVLLTKAQAEALADLGLKIEDVRCCGWRLNQIQVGVVA